MKKDIGIALVSLTLLIFMYFVLKSIKCPVFVLFLPSWGGFWDVYTLFFTE